MIYGTPGASLITGHFGTSSRRAAGRAGEILTSQVLNSFWRDAEIFHDLAVPGMNANVDHAVLAGNRLLLIDTKLWAAGRYWSFGNWYYRGTDRRYVPSQAVRDAHEAYQEYLPGTALPTPVVALWSGVQTRRGLTVDAAGHVRGVASASWETARPFLHFHYPGARVITGNKLHGVVKRFIRFAPGPDPAVVRALTGLVHQG